MILYLHGFNSAGYGQKFLHLIRIFNGEVICSPTYPSHLPSLAIKQIESTIDNLLTHFPAQPLMLAGSSLGGFYACWLAHKYQTKCVCINPALDPLNILHGYLGWQENFYTGERYFVSRQQLLEGKRYYLERRQMDFPLLILLDKGDEVIDYRTTLSRLPQHTDLLVFEGGDHRFQHWQQAKAKLKQFYIDPATWPV